MFVFLSKALPPLIYPLGLVGLLILAAILFRKRIRIQITFLVIALAIVLLGGNRYVAMTLARSLESRVQPPEQFEKVDAIVVLGGGTEAMAPPRKMVEVNGAGDRVIYAAKLYRDDLAPTILVSGGYISWLNERPSTPAEEMKELLLFVGVPESAIWLQSRSQNTYEDALYSSQILIEKGINRIILVTSAMHMPRSYALFTAQGLEVIPAPADYAVPDYLWNEFGKTEFSSILINLIPSASSLSTVTNCIKEYLGILIYHLQGWL